MFSVKIFDTLPSPWNNKKQREKCSIADPAWSASLFFLHNQEMKNDGIDLCWYPNQLQIFKTKLEAIDWHVPYLFQGIYFATCHFIIS